jgi:ubiquinone/menaquinone biosynthesis C-methylase UbiE
VTRTASPARSSAGERVVPAAPAGVLDVATSTAGVALRLVARTDARVTGIDLTEAMLRRGAENVDHSRRTVPTHRSA